MHLPEWWEGFVVGVALVVGISTAWRNRPNEREWRAMARGRRRDCARQVGPPLSHVRRIEHEHRYEETA